MALVVCGCSALFHKRCVEGISVCPMCGRALGGKENKESEEDARWREIASKKDPNAPCYKCRGKIKENVSRVRCRCGNIFHTVCAERIEICPECGWQLL